MDHKVVILTVACFIVASLGSNVTSQEDAKTVAGRLMKRYKNTRSTCIDYKNDTQPAYYCSGILIRGFQYDTNFQAWGVSPRSIKLGALSVAYLRHDVQFTNLWNFDSGFIILPQKWIPRKKFKPKVYCAYPYDANTFTRLSDHGCGESIKDDIGQSGPCHVQGITTFSTWRSHFEKAKGSDKKVFMRNQCSFDMTSSNASEVFKVVLAANSYLRHNPPHDYISNEIMMQAWDEERTKTLPIEAFFYFKGKKDGLSHAQYYQADFKKNGGGYKPIIEIQLPDASGEKFKAVGIQ